jgi:hypothetical protein
MLRRLLPVVLVAVVAAGCGGGDDGGAAVDATGTSAAVSTTTPLATTTSKPPLVSTTATTAPTTATTAPATTAPPTTAAPELDSFPTAKAAADALFDAWVDGDEDAARHVAPGDVVDTLFRSDGSTASETYIDQDCIDDPEGGPGFWCQWSYEGGAMSIVVEPDPSVQAFRITDIRFFAD